MRIFQIPNGKRPLEVVSGLSWHPLVPDSFKSELIPLSTDMGADLYVYRKSSKSLVGLAKTKEGVKVGQVPIALVVAQALESESAPLNALVAVAIPEEPSTYIYISIRDGFILADGDIVGTEDEIQSRMLSDLSVGGWDLMICPGHWRVNDSTSRDLESFLPRKGNSIKIPDAWKLKPTRLAWQKTVVKLGLLLLIVGATIFGYKSWEKKESQKREAIAALQREAEQEQQRIASLQKEPWPAMPRATTFAVACEDAIDRTGLIVANWALSEFVCEGDRLTVKWERSNPTAWIHHLKQLRPSAVVSADGVFASVGTTLRLPQPNVVKGVEPLPNVGDRTEYFQDLPNKFGMTVLLKSVASTTPTPPAGPVNPTAPRWVELSVAATTPLRMSTAAQILDGPAFRLLKIVGTSKGGSLKYQLTGTQYAKP